MERARRLIAELLDLALPRTCAGCGRPRCALCPGCARLLTAAHLAAPRRFPDGFPPTVAAGAYAGPVRSAVIQFKERGRAELGRPLGAALALAVAGVLVGVPWAAARPVLLVPLPSTPAALRGRGRDHVRELTRAAVAELRAAGVDAVEARLLRRRGRVRDSAGLTAGERRANLAGSFVARGGLVPDGAVVVLVDDVVTSGASLTEAAAALRAGRGEGAVPVLGAVVAATPRPDPVTVRPGGPASLRGARNPSADRLSVPGEGD